MDEDQMRKIQEEAERLLSYWEMHGHKPEVVAKWAVEDLLGFVRFFAGGVSMVYDSRAPRARKE